MTVPIDLRTMFYKSCDRQNNNIPVFMMNSDSSGKVVRTRPLHFELVYESCGNELN